MFNPGNAKYGTLCARVQHGPVFTPGPCERRRQHRPTVDHRPAHRSNTAPSVTCNTSQSKIYSVCLYRPPLAQGCVRAHHLQVHLVPMKCNRTDPDGCWAPGRSKLRTYACKVVYFSENSEEQPAKRYQNNVVTTCMQQTPIALTACAHICWMLGQSPASDQCQNRHMPMRIRADTYQHIKAVSSQPGCHSIG
jgi:hypothetical protein